MSRKAKQGDQASLMTKEVFASGSYEEALGIMSNGHIALERATFPDVAT